MCRIAVADRERSDEVNRHQNIWGSLRLELIKVVGNKCWYSEAPLAGSDKDVDHFRPKNAVRDVYRTGTGEKHPGYWWLAFSPSNYRLSCAIANRKRRDLETGSVGGKGDEFPLFNEDKRAWIDIDDYFQEQPLLIDPCNAGDVTLITFSENGEAIERYSEQTKPRLFKRAEKSIELYHLNHTDFVKERIQIRDRIQRNIEDAQRFYRQLETGDSNVSHAYGRAIEALREACNIRSPFSGFAAAMLFPYREDESLEGVFR